MMLMAPLRSSTAHLMPYRVRTPLVRGSGHHVVIGDGGALHGFLLPLPVFQEHERWKRLWHDEDIGGKPLAPGDLEGD